jgi:acetolactate synthase-1/2/3 large subunit
MVCGIITIVANNGMYGTIRMHQEREYPRRVVGTTLINPDFAAYARSFGADGLQHRDRRRLCPGVQERAQQQNRPAVIELKLDPEAISPRQTLTALRERA